MILLGKPKKRREQQLAKGRPQENETSHLHSKP